MVEIDTGFVVVAVLFGALMGSGLGRDPGDRVPAIVTASSCTTIGLVSWLASSPGTQPEIAGVSMTIGCATAAAVVAVFGRRATT